MTDARRREPYIYILYRFSAAGIGGVKLLGKKGIRDARMETKLMNKFYIHAFALLIITDQNEIFGQLHQRIFTQFES